MAGRSLQLWYTTLLLHTIQNKLLPQIGRDDGHSRASDFLKRPKPRQHSQPWTMKFETATCRQLTAQGHSKSRQCSANQCLNDLNKLSSISSRIAQYALCSALFNAQHQLCVCCNNKRYVAMDAYFYTPFITILTLQKSLKKNDCLLEAQALAEGPALSHSVILLCREPVLNVISDVMTSNPAIAVSLSMVG